MLHLNHQKQILIFNNDLLTLSNLESCFVIFPIKKLLNAEILSTAPQMLVETNIKFNCFNSILRC